MTLTYFTARSNLKLRLFYRKKWKQWIFQKLLKPVTWKLVDTDNLLTSWRYVSIEGQGHYLTLAQGCVHSKIQTTFSQKLLGHSELNFVWKLSGTRKWKSDDMMLVTWPRWPPCQYMVKPLQKYSSPEPAGCFSRNLVCSIGDSCPS